MLCSERKRGTGVPALARFKMAGVWPSVMLSPLAGIF